MKITWNKLPSVRREGKSFYVTGVGTEKRVWVMQDWSNNLWFIQYSNDLGDVTRYFKSAKAAMKTAEKELAETT